MVANVAVNKVLFFISAFFGLTNLVEYIETLFSYSSSVTIGYVYSIFVEKNAMPVGICTKIIQIL
ncbi:hypothetical protein VA249_38400 [Vibrio alfacsensis]|nr:hypothetical protein VA249_38400 [Vibrio alfacsensis]